MLGSDPHVLISVSGAHCSKKSGAAIHGERGCAELHDAYDDHIMIRDRIGEERVPIDTTFPLYFEVKEFLEYLNGGHKPRCDLNDAWEMSRSILKLRKAGGLE
jgi:hypothetical protein